MHARVEIFTDRAGEHRWRLRAANGEIVAPPEGHRDIHDAVRAFGAMRVAANEAADHPVFIVVDEPDGAPTYPVLGEQGRHVLGNDDDADEPGSPDV